MFKRIQSWTNTLAQCTLGRRARGKAANRHGMRGLRLEPLERRELLTASVSGSKWNDVDGDGVRDAGEPGLAGWTMYVDGNENGQLDTGELSTVTAADGSYTLLDVAPGTPLVSEVPQAGWMATSGGGLQFLANWKDGVDGVDGLDGAHYVTISPDGNHVYATSWLEASLTVFSRNATTGALTFVEVYRDNVNGVDGLNRASDLVVSPDGAYLYVAGYSDHSLTVFSRNATTGQLALVECLKDGIGGVDGLYNAMGVTLSPDGAHIYVAGFSDDAVAVFSRNAADGRLTFVECKKDGVGDTVNGLNGATSVTVSPDGAYVYITGEQDNAVTVFSRNAADGRLTYVDCLVDGVNGVDRIAGAREAVVSPDGAYVYVGANTEDALAVFSRDPVTGRLTYLECFRDNTDGVNGLDSVLSVSLSPDGTHLYLTGYLDNALAVFRRNSATGRLTFVECMVDSPDGINCLGASRESIFSPDGAHLYVTATGDDSLLLFGRARAGQQWVSVAAEQVVTDVNFGSNVTARVSGLKWNDVDGDGVRDAGEPGLAGWTIYVDGNENGQLDTGELSTVTAADGSYTLLDVAPGTPLVSEVPQAGWVPTSGGGLQFLANWKDGVGGVDGMDGPCSLTTSPDGAHVYVTGYAEDTLAVFRRSAATGVLTFVEVHRDGVGGAELNGATNVVVSPDGAHVYVASVVDDTVTVFRRNATTGSLTWVETKKDGVDGVDGLDGAWGVTVSPDGASVYVASSLDHAVAVFSRSATTGALTWVETKKDGVDGIDGLYGAVDVELSPNGDYLYVAGQQDDAVAVFRRNAVTGVLTFVECLKDGVGNVDGLDWAVDVEISPDGGYLYMVGANDDAVTVFSRNTVTGALTFVETKKDGVDGVDGLDQAISLSISPDGSHVYVAGMTDDTVAVFRRNPTTGTLTFLDVQRDGVGGVDGLDGARGVIVSPDGAHLYVTGYWDDAVSAFDRARTGQQWVSVAAEQVVTDVNFGSDVTARVSGSKWNDVDGDGVKDAGEPGLAGWTMYVDGNQNGQLDAGEPSTVTAADGSYTLFDVAPGTPLVSEVPQAGWVPTTGGGLQFLANWADGVGGVDGLDGASSVTLSSNGSYVYVTGLEDDALAVFSRDAATGALALLEVHKDGVGSVDGLDGAISAKVSPDGMNVYVASINDDAIAVFRRNTQTGRLTFLETKKDVVGGGYGLDGVWDVTLSADGAYAYTAARGASAVSVFSRNPTTGALTFLEAKRDGLGGVEGLVGATCTTLSPDGAYLYVTGRDDDAVAVFSRNATTGRLAFVEYHKDGVGGVRGLDGAVDLVLSPDGAYVYVASIDDDAVAVFSRNVTTGRLAFVEYQKDGVNGADWLNGAIRLTTSPDGSQVYVAAVDDSAVTTFRRNPVDGKLTVVEHQRNGIRGADGLAGAHDVIVSPDGAHLYVVGSGDDTLAAFGRARAGQQWVSVEAEQTVTDVNFGDVADLVARSLNGVLTISGTAGNDLFEVRPGDQLGRAVVTVNGASRSFTAREIIINGAGGEDTINLYDSVGNDTLIVTPTQVVLTYGCGVQVTAHNIGTTRTYATAGDDGRGVDWAYLVAGNSGDSLVIQPGYASVSNTGYSHRVDGFESLAPTTVPFADPDLVAPVWQALGLSSGTTLTSSTILGLTSLTADSSLIDSLQGLQYATNLESLALLPSDASQPGHLTSLQTLSGLTKLQTLTLQRLGITDTVLAGLPYLPSLKSLDLRYNNLAVLPSAVANLSSLGSLLVHGSSTLTSDPRAGLAVLAGKPVNVDLAPDHPEKARSVAELAAALYKLPIEMYEYVVNTIEFEHYEGAMKGVDAVVQTHAANDWEAASLLSSLFAQAGISTRYVSGSVEAPLQEVLDWLGVADGLAAQNILNAIGGNATPVLAGQEMVGMQFDHRWLEARFGSTWVALDPSWKMREHRDEVRSMLAEVPYDVNPATSEYFASVTTLLPNEYYEQKVREYLAQNDPGVSIAEIPYAGAIIPQSFHSLPTSLPYQVNTSTVIGSSIPSENTHRVRLTLKTEANTVLLQHVLVLPEMSLKQVTIEPYVVSGTYIRPRLLLDGAVVAESTLASPDGDSLVYVTMEQLDGDGDNTVDLTSPTAQYRAKYYVAITLDASQISSGLVSDQERIVNEVAINKANGGNPSQDDLIGGLLHLAGLKYHYDADIAEHSSASLTGGVRIQQRVACGLIIGSTTLQAFRPDLTLPYLPTELGINLLTPGRIALPIFDPTEYNQSHTISLNAMHDRIIGDVGSAMEHAIWEELANTTSLSTVKSLQLARERSIPIYAINSGNAGTYMPQLTHLQAAKDWIQPWINQGYTVTIPRDPVPLGTWWGVGFIVTNPAGDWNAYIIWGNIVGGTYAPLNGGQTTAPPEPVDPMTNPSVPQTSTRTYAGDPVDVASGTVVHDETDLAFPGLGFPLGFARHYQSSHTGDLDFDGDEDADFNSNRGMDEGWSFTYSDRLETSGDTRDPAGTKIWFTGAGDRLKFEPDGSGYKTPEALFGQLTRKVAGGYTVGYTWTDKTGSTVEFDAQGRLLQMQDRYGNGVVLSYYSDVLYSTGFWRIHYVRDLQNQSSRYLEFAYGVYNGRLVSVRDFTSPERVWNYEYDGEGRLHQVIAPSDSQSPATVVTYEYYTDSTRDGLLKKVIAPNGGETAFTYYANRRAFEVTNAENGVHRFSYNTFRDRTEYADERGTLTYYTHNDKGNVVEEVYPDRSSVVYTWNESLRTAVTDAFGQTESYVYDSNGNITQLTDREGYVTTFTYTDYSNIATITWQGDPNNPNDDQVTQYRYFLDSSGKASSLQEIEDAEHGITSYTYPTVNCGLPESVTTPNGNLTTGDANDYTTTYTYNAAGQVLTRTTRVSAAESITETFTYDDRGNLLTSTDGNLQTTTYTYDLLGRPKTRTLPDPDGSGELSAPAEWFTYDAMGNLLGVVDTTGRENRLEYDAMGRLVKATNADGTYRLYTYDAAGNLATESDELGRATRHYYDDRNRPSASVLADGSMVRFAYDGGGRLVGAIDGRGNVTEFRYDKLGRKTAEVSPDPDGQGPLGPMTTRFGYDAQGNLQYITDTLGTSLGDPNHSVEYTYDHLGRMITEKQAAPSAGAARPTIYYGYDANSNLTYVTDPRGGTREDASHTTQYVYDEANRVIRETLPDPDGTGPLGTLTTRYFYDANGNLRFVVDPRGTDAKEVEYTTEYQYDFLNRTVKEIGHDPDGAGNPALDRPVTDYQYDVNGNLASVTTPGGGVTRYQYDKRNRQVRVTDALGDYAGDLRHSTTIWYDAVGNVLFVTDALGQTTSYQYDGLNRLVKETQADPDGSGPQTAPQTAYVYDTAGNLASTTDSRGFTTWYQYDALNRSTGVTDALGYRSGDPAHTTVTRYDSLGNVAAVTDPLGRTVDYQYDNLGRLTAELQPQILLDNGQLARPTTTYAYDANGNVTSVTDPLSHVTRYQYDNLNRQTCVTDALGTSAGDRAHSVFTTYDAVGNVIRTKDQLGRVTNYRYDNLGRLVEEYLPCQQIDDTDSTGFTLAGAWTLVTGSGENGQCHKAQGRDTAKTATWTFDGLTPGVEYELFITWPGTAGAAAYAPVGVYNGSVAPETWLGATYLDQRFAPPGDAVQGENWRSIGRYTPTGDTLCVLMQANVATSAFVIADAVRIVQVGAKTTYAYDAAGNLASVTDPLGQTTWYQYDALNRPTQVIDALGTDGEDSDHATVTVYDAVGNIVSVTDSEENTTSYTYDRLGRLVSETTSSGTRFYAYDAAGNLVQQTDRNGRATQYVYDPFGVCVEERWLNQSSQVIHTTHNWYDAAGQLVGITETDTTAAASATSYQYDYDAAGNVVRARVASGDLAQPSPTVINGSGPASGANFDWDLDGVEEQCAFATLNLTAGQVVLVKLTSSQFDPVLMINGPYSWGQRLVDTNSLDGHNAYLLFTADQAGTWVIRITTPDGNIGSYTLEILTNPFSFVPNAFAEFTYTYDAAGNVQTTRDTYNTLTEYDYDALDRLDEVRQSGQSGTGVAEKRVDFAYHNDSRANTTTRYANLAGTQEVVTTTYDYDGIGRLTDLVHRHGTTTIADYGWAFDAAGRVTQMTSADGTSDFGYDATNQLTVADHSYQTDEGYTYDANGNRTNAGYVTDAQNRMTSDGTYRYEYDAEGNRTARYVWTDANTNGQVDAGERTQLTQYTWDHRNRLVNVTERPSDQAAATRAIDYAYDAFNHLVRRSLDSDANGTPDAVAKYVYDGDDLALEFDGADALTHRYLWNSAVDEVLADEQIGGQVVWPLADHEGSIRDLVNSTGTVVNHRQYDAFGQLTAETNAAVDHHFAYTGQYRDEATGLQNHLNRWYDPAVGRWISEDPIGFGGGDANLYRYVGNNPANFVDPSGLCGSGSSSGSNDTPSSDHNMPPWWPGPGGNNPANPGWPSSNPSTPPVPSPVRPMSPADVARGQGGGRTTGAPSEPASSTPAQPVGASSPSSGFHLFGQPFVMPWNSQAAGFWDTLGAYGRATGVAAAGTASGAASGAVTGAGAGAATGAVIGAVGGAGVGAGPGALAGAGAGATAGAIGGGISGFVDSMFAEDASSAAYNGAISGGISGLTGGTLGAAGGVTLPALTRTPGLLTQTGAILPGTVSVGTTTAVVSPVGAGLAGASTGIVTAYATGQGPQGNTPKRVPNPKHHPNSASPEPSNVQKLFDRSIVDKNGVRWAKDADGTVHRFSAPRNGETHWNGSTAGDKPIRWDDIPIAIRRALK